MNRKQTNQTLKPIIIGAVVLAVAVIVGTVINFLTLDPSDHRKASAESVPPTPEAVVTVAPPPTPTPTPTPTVNSIKLIAYGRELDADGFTTYVGDQPSLLSLELDPTLTNPPVVWNMSDSESASLTVSDDRMSCEFTALKPSGKNELTISCYGTEVVFPVYLWER